VAKGGLGKGLTSLVGSAAVESGSNTDYLELRLIEVEPNPDQPRTDIGEAKLSELAESIKKDGLLQPILVRPHGEKFQIIAGERRYQACKKLGMDTITAKVVSATDLESQEFALVENLQRDNLNPIEEALGYKKLMELGGYKQKEIALAVSKDSSTISNSLRLLDLPVEVQELMFDGKIAAGHARAILSIPVEEEEKRIKIAKKIAEEGLSVREAENAARLFAMGNFETGKRGASPRAFKLAARKLRQLLNTNVRVKSVRGKNKIEIEFTDEDDLQRIYLILSSKTEQQAGE
jgi:ParB family chromosome partitioning protein